MRRRQPDFWCPPGFERLLPAFGAKAPAIARLEPRKAEFGHRCRQIVADRLRERQKRGIELGADSMHPEILGSGVAAAIPIEASHRLDAAFGEWLAEDVARIGYRLSLHGFGSGRTAIGTLGKPHFDRVPDLRRNLDPVEPRDFLDAGRRGDVDLGQPVADHVDTDKDEPFRT